MRLTAQYNQAHLALARYRFRNKTFPTKTPTLHLTPAVIGDSEKTQDSANSLGSRSILGPTFVQIPRAVQKKIPAVDKSIKVARSWPIDLALSYIGTVEIRAVFFHLSLSRAVYLSLENKREEQWAAIEIRGAWARFQKFIAQPSV